MSTPQSQMVAAILVTAVVLVVLAYYTADPLASMDPLRLYKGREGMSSEAAFEALMSALEKEKGKRAALTAQTLTEKDAEAIYEKILLGGLKDERRKKIARAKEHARETVALVVEEMAEQRKSGKWGAEAGEGNTPPLAPSLPPTPSTPGSADPQPTAKAAAASGTPASKQSSPAAAKQQLPSRGAVAGPTKNETKPKS